MEEFREAMKAEIVRQLKARRKATLKELTQYVDRSLLEQHLGPIGNEQSMIDEIIWDLIIKRAITPKSTEGNGNNEYFASQEFFVSDESKLS